MKKVLLFICFFCLVCPALAEDVEVKAPAVNVTLTSPDADAKITGYSVDVVVNSKEYNYSMMQTSDVPFYAKIKAGALRLGGRWKTQDKMDATKGE